MLDYIRKRSGGFLSIAIIGAIALVFIFWGIGGRDTGTAEDIRIDGQPISQMDFFRIKENIEEQMRQRGGDISPTDELNARRQALAYIVERHNLLTLAKNTGRRPSIEAINRAVKANPTFQVDGRFNLQTYKELVPRLFNQSLSTYETKMGEDILVEQTVNMLQSLAYVPTQSALEDFHFSEDQLSLKFVFFPTNIYLASLEPTEDALSAYYEAGKDRWRRPAEAKIDYVEFKVDSYLDQAEVTQDDLEYAYQENLASLTIPEEAQVRHILIRFPSLTPTESEKAEALAKIQDILEKSQTISFATLASEFSQDTETAAKGGLMNTLKRGQTMPSFEEAVFGPGKDKLGQIIGPIETLFGYHLIMVDSYTPGHTKTLEEAKEELTKEVLHLKARRLAINKLEDLLESIPTTSSPNNLKDAAKTHGFEVLQSDFFSVSEDAPEFFESNSTLIEQAIATPIGQVGEPVDNPDLLVLYTPIEKVESFVPPLTDPEVREQVAQAWKEELAAKMANDAASDFIKAAAENGWDKQIEALSSDIEHGQTELFARLRFYEAGAYLAETAPNDLIAEFFRLAKVGDLVRNPLKVENPAKPGYLVLYVNATMTASEEELDEATLANRKKAARDNLASTTYAYWNSNRAAVSQIQLPPAFEAYFNDPELAGM
jgi:peptidyl-prolyl cis-trans isomerase D